MECPESQTPKWRLFVVAFWLTATLTGCGGSGSSEPEQSTTAIPAFELSFPPAASRTGADQLSFLGRTLGEGSAASITLTNSALPDSSTDVVLSMNAEGEWSGVVPLVEGDNEISVTVTNAAGQEQTNSVANVLRRLSLFFPSDMLVQDNLAYVLDNRLVELDLSTGVGRDIESSVASDLCTLDRLHAFLDNQLLTSCRSGAFLIDPATGTGETVFSSQPLTTGFTREFEYDATTNQLIVVLNEGIGVIDLDAPLPVTLDEDQIVSVNITGNVVGYDATRRNLIVQNFTFGIFPTIPTFSSLLQFINIDTGEESGFDLEFADQPLIVSSAFFDTSDQVLTLVDPAGQFFSLDADTGALEQLRSIDFSQPFTGLVGVNAFPDLWLAADRTNSSVVEIDKASGRLTTLFDSSQGSGPALGFGISGLRLDPVEQQLISTSMFALNSIGPDLGDRELIANLSPFLVGVPTGEPVFIAQGSGSALAIAADERAAYQVGFGPEREILRIQLDSGVVDTVASLEPFSKAPLIEPAVAIDADRRIVFLLDRSQSTAREFSQLELDSGATEQRPVLGIEGTVNAMLWDGANNRALVATIVDLGTIGTLRIYSQPEFGDAVLILEQSIQLSDFIFTTDLQQPALSGDGERFYVPIPGNRDIAEVTLAGPSFRLLNETTSLPMIPTALEVTDDGTIFAGSAGSIVFAINPTTGESVILSR